MRHQLPNAAHEEHSPDLSQIGELHKGAGSDSPIERINAHSGSDAWGEIDSIEYLTRALSLSSRIGYALPPISHETHRGRILCCPFATARVLDVLPDLRLTSDFSHWVIKTERMLDTPLEVMLLRQKVAPCVEHLHARIGTPQAPQVISVLPNALTTRAAQRFYEWWEDVWDAQWAASRPSVVTATVEYGPPEMDRVTGQILPGSYTPVDACGQPVSGQHLEVTLQAASSALRSRFKKWRATAC